MVSVTTAERSPALSGLIDDPLGAVKVVVNSYTYNAVNNGDGDSSEVAPAAPNTGIGHVTTILTVLVVTVVLVITSLVLYRRRTR